jgi:type I restriction enzyme, S subunit
VSEAKTGVIEDFADVVVGGTPSTRQPDYWSGDIVWVTPTDITAEPGTVLRESSRSLTHEGVRNSSARVVPAGSVLVTTRATIGPAVIAGCDLATNQGVTALVPGAHLEGRWLYYWVIANRREFVSRGAGNTFPEIARSKTKLIPIEVPNLDTQLAAVEVLAAVDDYADALRRKRTALEELLATTRSISFTGMRTTRCQ